MRIWIDLTDFLEWRGSLTGIQRVQYNISKLYVQSGIDVHFFIYKEKTRNFYEVEFNPEEVVRAGIVLGDVDNKKNKSRFIQKMTPLYIANKIKSSYRTKEVVSDSQSKCIFGSGDIVLVMGVMCVGHYIDDLSICKANNKFKLINFAFDMIPSLFPGYVVEWLPDAFTKYQKKVYAISDGVLAISKSTANDIRSFMKQQSIKNNLKISVVRIGEGINTDDKIKKKSLAGITSNKFILSVSTVECRKNHAAFFYILKEAKQRGIELPKIIIVGRDGWLTDDIRYIMRNDLDAKEQIKILNSVDDSELSWLYKNCLFTVFPSFYEGWGMPVAESLAYGKLCLSSNTSSMPEIAGDMIDYFSPYDTGEMLECVVKYLNPIERKKKENIIKHDYRKTSWNDMYSQISNFVSEVSNRN